MYTEKGRSAEHSARKIEPDTSPEAAQMITRNLHILEAQLLPKNRKILDTLPFHRTRNRNVHLLDTQKTEKSTAHRVVITYDTATGAIIEPPDTAGQFFQDIPDASISEIVTYVVTDTPTASVAKTTILLHNPLTKKETSLKTDTDFVSHTAQPMRLFFSRTNPAGVERVLENPNTTRFDIDPQDVLVFAAIEQFNERNGFSSYFERALVAQDPEGIYAYQKELQRSRFGKLMQKIKKTLLDRVGYNTKSTTSEDTKNKSSTD